MSFVIDRKAYRYSRTLACTQSVGANQSQEFNSPSYRAVATPANIDRQVLLTALDGRTVVAPAAHEELRNIQSTKHVPYNNNRMFTFGSYTTRIYAFVANVPLHSNINIVHAVVTLRRAIEL